MTLAYRTDKAIALHIRRGVWEVVPLTGYDPSQTTWREFRQSQKTKLATNRRAAIRIVKEKR